MARATAVTTVFPSAGLLRFLLSPKTQIMSEKKLYFPLKNPDCCRSLLCLPCGCLGWWPPMEGDLVDQPQAQAHNQKHTVPPLCLLIVLVAAPHIHCGILWCIPHLHSHVYTMNSARVNCAFGTLAMLCCTRLRIPRHFLTPVRGFIQCTSGHCWGRVARHARAVHTFHPMPY